ncbi:MAG: 2Fe-2S iron-sulfur cluster-binding protein [Ectothiorhodospiraceae bacterium]|nr:2Fe-2S iron-sulfur cluster-binding protein [Ectothiorhodospiraceae bacterium]
MTKIVFIDQTGARHEVEAAPGVSVMEAAMDNSIPGIYAECGGTCSCATCHCYVREGWMDKLDPMDDLEDGMLDGAKERRPNSRLSCQIKVTDLLEGAEFEVADNNL